MEQKTITLNLPEGEMQLIESMCAKKRMSKTALIRQCIRLYVAVERRLELGEKLIFEDKDKQKSEMVFL